MAERQTRPDRIRKATINKSFVKRLSLGIAVVSFAVLLILWDAGILLIPGLVPPERRHALPRETATETREEVPMDWAAWAEDQIRALYDVSRLESPLSLLTSAPYDPSSRSVVRQVFNCADRLSVFGGLILAEKDGAVRAFLPATVDPGAASEEARRLLDDAGAYPVLNLSVLTEVDLGNAVLTRRLTSDGRAVFTQADGSLAAFDAASGTLVPYEAPLMWSGADWETVPGDEGDGSGLTLVCENGLFGYRGSYTERNKVVPVEIPCVYPTAFPYAEGLAVMADETGRITIRNERGEKILTDSALLLRDNWREEETLCRFSHGLLRCISAVYGENGALLSRSDAIITARGKSFPLPDGYRDAAYREGIFTVTNGDTYGFYSADGAWIGDPVYSYASPFYEGLATVTGEEGKEGLLSRQGKELLSPAFEEVAAFSGGLAVLRDEAIGQVLLWKVEGQYPPPGEEVPRVTDRSYYERVPLSRGPKNTFDDGDDIIIVLPELDLPPWIQPKSTTRPVYTVPVDTGNPKATAKNPDPTEPVIPEPGPEDPPPSSAASDPTPPASSQTPPEGTPPEGTPPEGTP